MRTCIINKTDGYKLGHRAQYPDGTTLVYSNITARSSRNGENFAVAFWFQAAIKRLRDEFEETFFSQDIDKICADYEAKTLAYLGPNNVGSDHWRALHELGYIPMAFSGLPEGTKVPLGVPMLTFWNTHPDFFWLTNYFETWLSAELWQPITSATTAYAYRELLDEWAVKTGTDPEFVGFQGHDFSYRGMGGSDAAIASTLGHLLSFVGSDTFPAFDAMDYYYPVKTDDPMCMKLVSVAASEHSVMSCSTAVMGEQETFKRLITEVYPEGIVSLVSDTFDLWKVLTEFLPNLKDVIMARPEGSKLTVRPDSGNPVLILTGDENAEVGTPEHKGVIELLWDTFGGTETSTGHKMLDEHVGAIYGDAITLERAEQICSRLTDKGFASGNIVFGIGSFTYQFKTRDNLGMAIKATLANVNGAEHQIYKDPITDNGSKKSAKGGLIVNMVDGVLTLSDQHTFAEASDMGNSENMLQLIWEDGKFFGSEVGFDEIRAMLHSSNNES